jgi:FixJ family two-component response regulator
MQPHSATPLAAPVVLVVDDDPAVCNSLQFSLELEGYVVRTYPNGQMLLSEADLPTRGCLVLDQVMPGMSGLDLLARLRSRRVSLPAILITTNPSKILRQRAVVAGVALVEKPLLGNALLDGIREAIGRG